MQSDQFALSQGVGMAFGMLCQEGTAEIGTECFSPRQPAQ